VLYTTMMCPYCFRAKQLLEQKGIAYTEIDVGMDADLREEMTAKSGGRRTVPQIFVGKTHVGGSDDLYALERSGKLDVLLAGA
jgi:glutaredoxin 3